MCYRCYSNYRQLLAVSVGQSIEPKNQLSPIAVASLVCTCLHCGVFVLFYQRNLLQDLVTRFDFLFSFVQFLVFSLCMADTQSWEPTSIVVQLTLFVWLHWTLTLDALTPNMKRLMGFSKRYAMPVSATVMLSCVGILGLLFFTDTNPLRDRVLWSYQVSSTYTITIRVQTILIGRIVTILLWCSRQTVLFLIREEDELHSIHGALVYDNPYEGFPTLRHLVKHDQTTSSAAPK